MFKKTLFIFAGLILIISSFFVINSILGTKKAMAAESITVLSPNGGEEWVIGNTYRIRWNSTIPSDNYYISLLKNGVNYMQVLGYYTYSAGESYFDFRIPVEVTSPGNDYKIKVYNMSGTAYDISDANFSIVSPTVTVFSPNGGERVEIGKTYRIGFNATGFSDQYYISLLKNGVNYMQVLGYYTYSAGDCYFDWSVPSGTVISPGDDYKIKVYNASGTVEDISNANFTIFSNLPAVTVINPNGGENIIKGQNYTIGWNVNWRPEVTDYRVNIYYRQTAGSNQTNQTIASGVLNQNNINNYYTWSVPSTLADGTYKIVITASGYGTNLSDESDTVFNITSSVAGSISVLSPIAGGSYRVGDTVSIQWTMTGSVGPAGEATIWLYKGNQPVVTLKGANVSTSNQWNWLISSSLGIVQSGSDYKIRIVSLNDPSIYGETGYFTISPTIIVSQPLIVVTSPNGGEQWVQGSTHNISWTSQGTIGGYGINLFKSDGSVYSQLVVDNRTTNFTWAISNGLPVGQYKIEVYSPRAGVATTASNYKEATDSSDNYFSIIAPGVIPPDERCLPDGTLIKIPTDPKIYVIRNCKKEWIQTAEEFRQEGYKWEDVKEVNSSVVQSYSDYLQATANLLRAIGQQKVYRVVDGKVLWVPTVSAFNAQGLKWEDIQNVDPSIINQYSRLKLVRVKGDPKVYYLTESGLKRWVPTIEVFNSYNNKWEDVIELEKKDVNGYSDNVFIKLENDPKVYKIENGKRRWIKTEAAFNRLGVNWSIVSPVNQTEFNFYPEGAVIE